MSWDSVEAKVETMLKTAFKAATDSAALTVRYHCYWSDSAAQSFTLPAVVITASPAVNDGWRTKLVQVPVEVAVLTAEIDDGYRASAKAIYRKIRQAVEGATLAVSGWPNVAVSVERSSAPQTIPADEDHSSGLHVIPLSLSAEVALPLS